MISASHVADFHSAYIRGKFNIITLFCLMSNRYFCKNDTVDEFAFVGVAIKMLEIAHDTELVEVFPTPLLAEQAYSRALEAEVRKLSSSDLKKLEDDLDFYAFAGIASPLLCKLISFLSVDCEPRAPEVANSKPISRATVPTAVHDRPLSIAC